MLIRQHWKSIDKCVGFGIAALREMVTGLLTNSINVVYNPVFIYVKLGVLVEFDFKIDLES